MKRLMTTIHCMSCGFSWTESRYVPEEDREVKTCGRCIRTVTAEIAALFGVS